MAAEEKRIERKLIHFEGFTLDVGRRGLFRGNERVHLTSKPLETLIFLVENRGSVAGKQEILDAVWKDTFVTEDVLVQAVREIRRVLEDNKDNPRFIQTVPRQGYRFIGDVSVELPFSKSETGERAPLTVVTAQGPRKWLSLPRMLVALLGVAIISVFIWFVWKREGQMPQAANPNARSTSTLDPQSLKHLPTGEFPVGKPAFSPDGKLILYVGSSRETLGYGDIFIMQASGGSSVQITEKASPSGDLPVFTADGSHVVFSRPRGGEEQSRLLDLYVVPSSGGEMKVYLSEASGAGFSPDGKWLAYTKHLPSHKVLRLSSTDNLNEYREIAVGAFTPRWSPDGKWISYTTSDPNGGLGDIWVIDAHTLAGPKNHTNELQQVYGLTWSADSRSIIFSSKRTGPSLLWLISIDDGSLRQIVTDVGESSAPSAGPNRGSLVFQSVRVIGDLMLADLEDDNEPRQITHEEFHRWPRLSPSGEKVVSVMQRPDFGDHLYLYDVRSGTAIRLSDESAHHPCWIDEENVAYLLRNAENDAGTIVEVVNLNSKITIPLTRFSDNAGWLAIHPNRQKLAVVLISTDGKQKIVLRDLNKKPDQTIAEGAQYSSLRWLADGSALSWSGPAQASTPLSDGIWIYEFATRQIRKMASDGYGPVWNTDGRSFYYSRNREFSGLWQFDLSRGQTRKIRSWNEFTSFDLVGRRLLFAEGQGRGQIYSLKLSP